MLKNLTNGLKFRIFAKFDPRKTTIRYDKYPLFHNETVAIQV